jgi:hypothetical protein
MAIETPEQAARAQAQIERFACLAHAVLRAVEVLEDEFTGLTDWPEAIGETMPRLSAAAELIASAAWEWAAQCNVDFDPRSTQ